MGRLAEVPGIVAELAHEELADVIALTARINTFTRCLSALTSAAVPRLLAMPGVKFVGESAGVSRFTSGAAFARHAGIAPIPVRSGNTAGRVRLTRSVNRQLNAAIHRIAVTQIRMNGLDKTYYEKKKADCMSTPEAQRCLKHRLARGRFQPPQDRPQPRTTRRQRLAPGSGLA